MGDLDSVRVAVRIRPFAPYEQEKGSKEAIVKTPDRPQVIVNRSDAFTFNFVFDKNDSQEHVYNSCISDMLDKLFEGFNATILAYGQTGSGKTYTMGTHFDGVIDDKVGVIPRAMVDIFKRIEELSGEVEFNVKCSFMELYNEQLFDLLSSKARNESIVDMREDRTGIIIPGLTEETVNTAKETTDFLVKGSSGRAVASTAMNEQSSRSHAIFTLTIQATKKSDVNSLTTSKFHLVDLAGSERSKKTKAIGDRLKEGIKINQSLMVLGKVISALGTSQGNTFVCYRDSKLTRFLQDSLGGNSYTLMIACVSPADYNVDETLSTLRYADNARKIKNKPIVNQDPRVAENNHLKNIIQQLRLELAAAGIQTSTTLTSNLQKITPLGLKNEPASMPNNTNNSAALLKAHEDLKMYQQKCKKLQQQLQLFCHDMAECEMRAHLAEAANEKLKEKSDKIKIMVDDLKEAYSEDSKISELYALVNDMNDELQRTQSEMMQNKIHSSLNSDMIGNSDNDENVEFSDALALLQEHTERHTNKQVELKDELRRINRELNLKEELHQKVFGNLNKISIDDEKLKDLEQKIKELENERSDLLDKLKSVKDNTSAKLAEERRKRVQNLEHELTDLKRKMIQQAKMLKIREKETEKIKNLNREIQQMKESKVKLIRAMRQESDNFRQWKLTREKEVMQLKNKDRKMQNEMARKEALHTKQRNVLKRKCEEAMAINKRLKDALERQSAAQAQRLKNKVANSSATKPDHIHSMIERELEIITSAVQAEYSLEQLKEIRVMTLNRIEDLKKDKNPDQEELASLKDELDIRTVQITDLQQKVQAANIETRMRNLFEAIQSLGDARSAMKHLMEAICSMRREYDQLNAALEDQKSKTESTEERYKQTAKQIRAMQEEFDNQLHEKERAYEDKIAVLLREIQNAPHLAVGATLTPDQEERLRIQEEQLNKMDALMEELQYYKNLHHDLQQAVQAKRYKLSNENEDIDKMQQETQKEGEEVDLMSDDDFYYKDDNKNDPDWIKTPRFRRKTIARNTVNGFRRQKSANSSTSNSSLEETFATAATSTETNNNNNTTSNISRKKKKSWSGCSCAGSCNSKKCGCLKRDSKCGLHCKCSEACVNIDNKASQENLPPPLGFSENLLLKRVLTVKQESAEADDESGTISELKPKNMEGILNGETFLTPKVARLSSLPSLHTNSVKKRFLLE